jgi:hypothetical protein
MGFREDFVNAVRRRVWPQIHYLLDGTFGGYAVSHTTEDEYAMTVHCSEARLERALNEELGFSRNPISALKVRLDGNTSEGSWVRRESLFADWQLHLVLHATDEGHVDVYAHWEYSWITHPYKHYAAREYDAEKGVQLARARLGKYDGERFPEGLPYEIESPYRRRLRELVYRLYHRFPGPFDRAAALAEHVAARAPLLEVRGETEREGRGKRLDVSPRIALGR